MSNKSSIYEWYFSQRKQEAEEIISEAYEKANINENNRGEFRGYMKRRHPYLCGLLVDVRHQIERLGNRWEMVNQFEWLLQQYVTFKRQGPYFWSLHQQQKGEKSYGGTKKQSANKKKATDRN